ncbi:MAG TPA: peptidoglycan bridge formation glycyltransferase FemA/FemB family protein [Candidatus Saccharimonadales bacterium]|nr:peptidoglycan bridge formation glycyltransferase FemA/FemB family protein [Candidatus Saccharimonadales bacterium]
MKNSPSTMQVRECDAKLYSSELTRLQETLGNPVPLQQAPFYGAWQTRDGKTVVYFAVYDSETVIAAGIAVKFDAPGGISFFYCPYGPIVQKWTKDLFDALLGFFQPIAQRTGATFVRFDSPGLAEVPGVRPITSKLAVTASLQPRAEWLLNITGDEEPIWMGMHKHARYNVRLAERAKAQITFHEPSKAPLETFVSLMQTTAGRDRFSLQTQQYYEAVLGGLPADHGFMAVVTIDKKPAAAAVFGEYDGVLHYIFSGSGNDFRKIAPPYFMLWQTILEARRRGWTTLNFGGITDPVKSTHLEGVTGFKKRFGGYEIDHTNPVDLVYKPLKYGLFKLYKSLR